MSTINFEDLIRQNREEHKIDHFDGTFLEYLEKVRENPEIVKLAHQRMYELITKPGVTIIRTEEDPRLSKIYGSEVIKKYPFFDGEFFGMDLNLMQIVKYFHAAARAGEASRQVLYLVGPVGSGKSSLVESLKRALEQSPPIYALKDCPMHEEPLHLVPKWMRKQFQELLGVRIEGDLCPICRHRLENVYRNEYEKFPVETIEYSILNRVGFGVVPPVDPNNQDTSVLTGSVDISKLSLYSEDDPQAMSLNGAFNVGNRGIVEFIEVFKNQPEYLHAMITATQECSIPSPSKGSMIYFDGIILAHSNEAEWNKFKSDRTNEAIMDRIVKIEVPYCRELNEEIKIYQKLLHKSTFDAHIAPHTLEIASMFAILTRLEASEKVNPLTKLKIYNGEKISERISNGQIDIRELKDNAVREGMFGLSSRFIMKAGIEDTITASEHNCITPISLMSTLVKAIKGLSTLSDEVKKNYIKFIQYTLRQEYNSILEKEITKAFIHAYQEQAENLFNNYLDHAQAFTNQTKIKDRKTDEELQPDEKLMRSIEEQIGISPSAAKGFRQDVTSYMFSILRNGGKLEYSSYEPLREAIEKKLIASVRDLTVVVTTAKVRNKEQAEKYDAMVSQMISNGYCKHCCEVVLKYAANNLWRD